ncbi:hypothetical protein PVE_R2G0192 [Pseudomonas veronii 1YdBTEX2]|uniref:Uncharacterized protein n=1 Tax=Pseudomonas veronii 1YdBTEX2 TaxID=1295141 RepID=A0A1D3K7N8_PSEVE|nr:hypothetical protein PVE_R2G0192 [Pseudomonas veronii 1YdBTEX2]
MTELKTSCRAGGIELPHPNAIPIALCFGRNLHSKIVLDVVGTRYPKHTSRIP